jgi:hypothetical protein
MPTESCPVHRPLPTAHFYISVLKKLSFSHHFSYLLISQQLALY